MVPQILISKVETKLSLKWNVNIEWKYTSTGKYAGKENVQQNYII